MEIVRCDPNAADATMGFAGQLCFLAADMPLTFGFMQACLKLLDGAYFRSWGLAGNARRLCCKTWGIVESLDIDQRYECIYVDKTKAWKCATKCHKRPVVSLKSSNSSCRDAETDDMCECFESCYILDNKKVSSVLGTVFSIKYVKA